MSFDITDQKAVLGYPEYSERGQFRIPVVIDYSKVNDGNVVPAASETTFLKLPAECEIFRMQQKVEKVEGGVLTADIGDQDAANNWFNNLDLNALGSGLSTLITTGKYFGSTGPTLRITNDQDADVAIVTVTVWVIDYKFRLNDPLT